MQVLRTLFWWACTIAVLVIVDDLTSGPVFWLLAQVNAQLTLFFAFVLSWGSQVYLVRSLTSDSPSRLASAIIRRLEPKRKNNDIAVRERKLVATISGYTIAIPMSLLIGGVLPPLFLHRAGFARQSVRRLSLLTGAVYAAEFAFLHAYLPAQLV